MPKYPSSDQQEASYKRQFMKFLLFLEQKEESLVNDMDWERDVVNDQERLECITPDDVCSYMNFKVYHTTNPGDIEYSRSLPLYCRANTLEFIRKSLSRYMPKRDDSWDDTRHQGNPVKSKEVSQLIKEVREREKDKLDKGTVQSQEQRAIELEELTRLLLMIKKPDSTSPTNLIHQLSRNNNSSGNSAYHYSTAYMYQYGVASMLTLQWQLIARTDTMFLVKFLNIEPHPNHEGTLRITLTWHKNRRKTSSVDAQSPLPRHILLGSLHPRLCPLLNLAAYLETLRGVIEQYVNANTQPIPGEAFFLWNERNMWNALKGIVESPEFTGQTDDNRSSADDDDDDASAMDDNEQEDGKDDINDDRAAAASSHRKRARDTSSSKAFDKISSPKSGKIGSHSTRKGALDFAISCGMPKDFIDQRGRASTNPRKLAMNQRTSNLAQSLINPNGKILAYPDANVASVLTGPLGPCRYVVKDEFSDIITDELLAQVVARNIYFMYGIKMVQVLALPLIWAAFAEERDLEDDIVTSTSTTKVDLIPHDLKQSIRDALPTAGGSTFGNPIQRVRLHIVGSHEDLTITDVPDHHVILAPSQLGMMRQQQGLIDCTKRGRKKKFDASSATSMNSHMMMASTGSGLPSRAMSGTSAEIIGLKAQLFALQQQIDEIRREDKQMQEHVLEQITNQDNALKDLSSAILQLGAVSQVDLSSEIVLASGHQIAPRQAPIQQQPPNHAAAAMAPLTTTMSPMPQAPVQRTTTTMNTTAAASYDAAGPTTTNAAIQGQQRTSAMSATSPTKTVNDVVTEANLKKMNDVWEAAASAWTHASSGRKNKKTVEEEILAENAKRSKGPRKLALLSERPKTLVDLWTEYQYGIDERIPAKDFTPTERGRTKAAYCRRKHFWDTMLELLRHGHTVESAINKVHDVYGAHTPVTKILTMLRDDKKKSGGNPALFEK